MKKLTVLQFGFVISMAIALAATTFAQGVVGGATGAVGAQTKGGASLPPVNAGGGAAAGAGAAAKAGASTNGANVNAGAQTNTQTNTTAQTGVAGAAAKVSGNTSSSVTTHIQSNPALMSKVQAMLPPRMSMDEAAAGFKTQGQFIAALEASNNLKIPFDQLHTRMTGSNSVSLGAAIKQARPEMDEKSISAQVKTAEKAAADIEKK